jgi:hypothetical protein
MNDTSSFVLWLVIALANGLLWFFKNIRIVFPISVKNVYGSDCIQPVAPFRYYDVLVIPLPPTEECGLSFQLYVYYSVSFINIL